MASGSRFVPRLREGEELAELLVGLADGLRVKGGEGAEERFAGWC